MSKLKGAKPDVAKNPRRKPSCRRGLDVSGTARDHQGLCRRERHELFQRPSQSRPGGDAPATGTRTDSSVEKKKDRPGDQPDDPSRTSTNLPTKESDHENHHE